jgi:HPt (histidine-containing phosphotransfer) domain-containing protein
MSELITINTEKIIDDFDEDYLISTIKLFLEETYVDNLNKMEEGYKNKDKSKIKVAAHTVKSSSGYLGCPYFSKQCEKMEEIAKNGTWDDVEGFWKEYRTNYELLHNCAKKVYDEFTKKREDDNAYDNIMEDNQEIKIDSKQFFKN